MAEPNPSEVRELKEALIRGARFLQETGVLSHSFHGNMSVRVPGTDHLVMTGSSLARGLRTEELVVVDLQGHLLDGELDSVAAEIVQMHTSVYFKRPDVCSVIHTHSPHATAFAVASKPIECVYEGLVRAGIVDPVPVAKYAPRGSDESVKNIMDVVGTRDKAVLLENHGILAFDRDVMSAARVIVLLEEAAELTIRASLVGTPKKIAAQMIEYAQERAQRFAQRGTIHAESATGAEISDSSRKANPPTKRAAGLNSEEGAP